MGKMTCQMVCTQRAATLAQAVGDGLQRLLGGADDQRQAQQPQRKRTGQYAVTEIQVVYE